MDGCSKGCGTGCMGMLVIGTIGTFASSLGMTFGKIEIAEALNYTTLAIAALLLAAVIYMAHLISTRVIDTSGFQRADQDLIKKHQAASDELKQRYLKDCEPFKAEYKKRLQAMKDKGKPISEQIKLREAFTNEHLKPLKALYLPEAEAIEKACREEELVLCEQWKRRIPNHSERLQQGIRGVGVMAMTLLVSMFFFNIGAEDYGKTDKGPVEGWSVESLELPHLTDGSRYVSNPDSVLTAATEDSINQTMMRMDDELGIESAVVAVRKVKDGDVFRLAQDLFDKYGIGKDDRGLVIILATEDRAVRTHTGRSLEADLTDVECRRLQERFLVPYMRMNMPNEGLKALTSALLCHLSAKDLPTIHVPDEPVETIADQLESEQVAIAVLLVIWGLVLLFLWNYLDDEKKGIKPHGVSSGPWYTDSFAPIYTPSSSTSSSSGSSHRSSFWSGSSSSYSGSSSRSSGYSGGSSGGGGATSRW